MLVRKDTAQLLAWRDAAGKTGLDHTLELIARQLQAEEESGSLFIGDLIIHLMRRAGDAVLPILPQLLEAMVKRMASAKTATFVQVRVLHDQLVVWSSQRASESRHSLRVPHPHRAP